MADRAPPLRKTAGRSPEDAALAAACEALDAEQGGGSHREVTPR